MESTVQETLTISRESPYQGIFLNRKCLTGESRKETYTITVSCDQRVVFEPGDSLAIFPKNSPSEVSMILEQIHADPDTLITYRDQKCTAYELLTTRLNIQKVGVKLLAGCAKSGNQVANKLMQLSPHEQREFMDKHTLLSFLQHVGCSCAIQDISQFLSPLLPRMFSIASSSTLFPSHIELLVTKHSYEKNGTTTTGTASRYLCEDICEGDTILYYVHHAQHFKLPKDQKTPIIMIGPGTGIAPFKSFLEERIASSDQCGHHWLIFGEQTRQDHFYYEEQLRTYEANNQLELDTAFSRDQDHKVYVQDILNQKRQQFLSLMDQGAILYICGDAKRMAKDVYATIVRIFMEERKLSSSEANQKLVVWRKTKQLQADTY